MNKKKGPWFLLFWFSLFMVIFMFMNSARNKSAVSDWDYSYFKQMVKTGNVSNVVVEPDSITGEYKDEKGQVQKFKTLPMDDPNLVRDMEAANIQTFKGAAKSWWMTLLVSWGPVLLLIIFWIWMMRGMMGGGKQAMNFGKSKAKKSDGQLKVTFQDVAGCAEPKEELGEIISFLKDPQKFKQLGGKIPKGVLLCGSPGTGKTLLAKAVAGEAGVPFFSASGSEFVEMFVGVGASRVRDLFDQGRKNAPCLLFIDEIDAVGRHRFAGIGGGHDEREQTLNQMLVEMDGFDTHEGVILIAATNRPDVLDPALLRPGRFDRQIVVPNPTLKDRVEILQVHAKNIKMDESVNLETIAKRTPGFVGADLANVVNEAALLAARYGQTSANMKNFEDAIDRVLAGPARKSLVCSPDELKKIAYHESGHTIVAKILPHSDPVHKVSIIPRGSALGLTWQLPAEDKYLHTKQEAIARLAILFGGRAAEEVVFNEISTGASNDISQATKLATSMVTTFGMSEKIGPIALDKGSSEEIFLGRDIAKGAHVSEKMSELIDTEIKRFLDEALAQAMDIVRKHKDTLDIMVSYLLKKETLDAQEIDLIMEGKPLLGV
ncbi:MAG: ATP-dependent zinc metalloprotease FtsH [Elusimicrobiota bacterium]|jgi:cell division protease FtsH|nr:ATP-dependent zinc metalloprotease FtsH [Elusimicrobiota bacterium]